MPSFAPIRRHWRLIIAAILFASLITLWSVWFAIAHHRLTSRLALLQSSGETLDRKQLVWHPQPTTLPAGRFLHQALAAMSTTQLPPSLTELGAENVPFSDKWHAAAEQAIRANASTLSLARQARSVQDSQWAFGDLNPARALSILLGDAAIQAHHTGDDNEAIQRILDLRHLAWCMDRDPGTLTPLVAIGIVEEANFALHLIIAAPPPSSGRKPIAADPAQRRTLETLIPELLDDAPLRSRILFNLRENLVDEYQLLDVNIHGMTVLRPTAEIDAASVLEDQLEVLNAAQHPDYPAIASRHFTDFMRGQPLRPGPASDHAHVIREALQLHKRWPIIQIQFDSITRRRLLATDIAAQLYFADHGHWPASLSDLVPRYLPSVPADPFAAHGEPLAYALLTKNGVPRPVIGHRDPPGLNPPELPPEQAQFDFGIGSSENRWIDLTFPTSQPTTAPSATP